MLNRKDLHPYQESAINFIKEKEKCALFLDMGLGKTATTLTAISDFLDSFVVSKVLIIAPLRVANTVWKQEAKKWEHLNHLRIAICTGSEKERLKGLKSNNNIFVINRENVPWLIKNHKWVFDMVVVDESSSFKSPRALRFKALRKQLKHLDSVVLLTGTPAPNGLLDLWTQMFLIDCGDRLGKTMTQYKQRFFYQDGYMGYTYTPRKDAREEIKSLIDDVCISMDSKDYLQLPDRIDLDYEIEMPNGVQKQYDDFEKEFILLINETDIAAPSAAVLAGKLLQICNGAIYDENKNVHTMHDEKINCLKEIGEDNPNENLLVAYNFKSDLERLKKAFPHAAVLSATGDELKEWNKGHIKMLLAHPASAGHGLNAQYGGSVIVWFGLNWSLELYQQFNARIHRQGQSKPVRIIHIVAKHGMDEKVLKAIAAKAKTQSQLLEHLKKEV